MGMKSEEAALIGGLFLIDTSRLTFGRTAARAKRTLLVTSMALFHSDNFRL
jgi:hypothetical protein